MKDNQDNNPFAYWQKLSEENLEKWLAYWTTILNAWTSHK